MQIQHTMTFRCCSRECRMRDEDIWESGGGLSAAATNTLFHRLFGHLLCPSFRLSFCLRWSVCLSVCLSRPDSVARIQDAIAGERNLQTTRMARRRARQTTTIPRIASVFVSVPEAHKGADSCVRTDITINPSAATGFPQQGVAENYHVSAEQAYSKLDMCIYLPRWSPPSRSW
jgi:hypothetical protein